MEKIPGWVDKIFTPKVNELIGEVKALNTKVDSFRNEILARFEAVDVKISSLRNETKGDIESLRNEMNSRFEAVNARFDSLETRIPVMENLLYKL